MNKKQTWELHEALQQFVWEAMRRSQAELTSASSSYPSSVQLTEPLQIRAERT